MWESREPVWAPHVDDDSYMNVEYTPTAMVPIAPPSIAAKVRVSRLPYIPESDRIKLASTGRRINTRFASKRSAIPTVPIEYERPAKRSRVEPSTATLV